MRLEGGAGGMVVVSWCGDTDCDSGWYWLRRAGKRKRFGPTSILQLLATAIASCPNPGNGDDRGSMQPNQRLRNPTITSGPVTQYCILELLLPASLALYRLDAQGHEWPCTNIGQDRRRGQPSSSSSISSSPPFPCRCAACLSLQTLTWHPPPRSEWVVKAEYRSKLMRRPTCVHHQQHTNSIPKRDKTEPHWGDEVSSAHTLAEAIPRKIVGDGDSTGGAAALRISALFQADARHTNHGCGMATEIHMLRCTVTPHILLHGA